MSNIAEFPRPDNEALSVLLADVLLPILERVNQSLDELEQAVARIAEAPHG